MRDMLEHRREAADNEGAFVAKCAGMAMAKRLDQK